MRTKLQKFLRSYIEGVYTIQYSAYERNGLTLFSVGGHNIVLNWRTEITDLLQFFVFRLNLGQIMHHEKQYCLFDNLKMNFFQPSSQKNITYGQSRVLW